MKKVFDNAKFGDRFKTADGRLAIFWRSDEYANVCIVDGLEYLWAYDDFGREIGLDHDEYNIVGKLEE